MTRRDLPVRLSPRPVRALLRRLARSAFAAHLHAARYTVAGCGLILVCAVVVSLVTRDVAFTWEGAVDLRRHR